MGIHSTVEDSPFVLYSYLEQVAAENADLNCSVYFGLPAGQSPSLNYLMVGDWETGSLGLNGYRQSWAALPASAGLRYEPYSLDLTIRTWAGTNDPKGRWSDATRLFSGLVSAIVADPGGSDRLTPSGSWGDITMTVPYSGPMEGKGWGVYLAVTVSVLNAQLSYTA